MVAGNFRDSYRWKKLRKEILRRDGYECQYCGATERLEVHHMWPIRIGGQIWNPGNCITLCKQCHKGIDPDTNSKPKTSERQKWSDYLSERMGRNL